MIQEIQVIDSHTGGEPTRLIIAGGPDFAQLLSRFASSSIPKTLQQVVAYLEEHQDSLRRGIICEPRCSEHWVGAWLLPPVNPEHLCGVIFFNNVGYLGMCGHGTIGLMASLAFLNRVQPGRYLIETPVGVVETELLDGNHVRIGNVPSYLYRRHVDVPLPNRASVVGDLAWGGNWFFLTSDHSLAVEMHNLTELTRFAVEVQSSMEANGITGPNGQRVDHVELFVDGKDGANSRSFVLCPGGAYDRSPCGTGTSAKLACLAAEGKLQPGETWVQESVTGSRFQASYRWCEDSIAEQFAGAAPGRLITPSVKGSAFVMGETTLVFDPRDLFVNGIPV
ncbi:MAG: proline racemase family protein [Planctomycetaceae bacterium]|nr:proline racemase family protein [Planctomycetaceae bacterium]